MKQKITRQSDLFDLNGNKIDGFAVHEAKDKDGESHLIDVKSQEILVSYNSRFINFKREVIDNEELEKVVLTFLKKVRLIDKDNNQSLLRILAEGHLMENGIPRQRILPLYEHIAVSLEFYDRRERDARFGYGIREFLKNVISEQIEEDFNPPHYIYTDDFI